MSGPFMCPADVAAGAEPGEGTCKRFFPTKNGAVMHALNTPDDYHGSVESKAEGYSNIREVGFAPASELSEEPEEPGGTGEPEEPKTGPEGMVLSASIPEAPVDQRADRDVVCATEGCEEVIGTEAEVREALEAGQVWCSSCGAEVVPHE